MVGDRADFFVSHAGADRAWAEWVAWQLTDAGYTVELDVWDWVAGQNFITAMSDALARCDRVLALFSAAYFDRDRYTTEEWTAALLHQAGTGQGRLVPVRVEDVPPADMPPVLQTLLFCDLFGVDAAETRRVLLAAVAGPARWRTGVPRTWHARWAAEAGGRGPAVAGEPAKGVERPGPQPGLHRPRRAAGGGAGAAAD